MGITMRKHRRQRNEAAGRSEPVQDLFAAALECNRSISLQPEGQVAFAVGETFGFLAVCGVAALVDSGAINCAPRLASHPEKGLARLQKDLEQVLSIRGGSCPQRVPDESGTCGKAVALVRMA